MHTSAVRLQAPNGGGGSRGRLLRWAALEFRHLFRWPVRAAAPCPPGNARSLFESQGIAVSLRRRSAFIG